MLWTPNKITLLRVGVGFLAVGLFGRNACMNLLAVALTVTAIALDALDGHIARKKRLATPTENKHFAQEIDHIEGRI